MGISDLIASFISDSLNETGGFAEMQRAELAERFHCVPSQINYVISTRFSPEHGYIVESRRGGSGYIRITRVQAPGKQLIMHAVNSIGSEIDLRTAMALLSNVRCGEAVDDRDAKLMAAAIGDGALRGLPPELRDIARAGIFKYMLINSI